MIPDSVESIDDYVFNGCSGLTSITIGNSVTSIGNYAFYNCSGLTSITIGNSVTSIGNYAFYNCSGLTSITIGNSVETIGLLAFASCGKLEKISVAAGNSKYHSAGNCLVETETKALILGCKNSIIPADGSVTSVGGCAFLGSGVISIVIPNSVETIDSTAFADCSELEKISVAAGNSKYHSAGDCLVETETKTLILGCKNSIIPVDGSVTSIGEYAFYGCSGLTSITIPNGVKSIGDHAFSECSSLISITIPDSVEFIDDYAFSYCNALTSVTIPDSVTSIGYEAFAYCSSLTSVTIGNSVTHIGDYAFKNCINLNKVYYGSTAEEWNKLAIGSDNDKLTSATRYYYSETQPTESGNYWHYNKNGEIEEWQ